MTSDALLPQLEGVRQRGPGRWAARCPVPAHADNSPSLSICEGARGILMHCFAGCPLDEICSALHLQKKDLFFDSLDTDPKKRKAAALARERERQAKAAEDRKHGRRIDARREAEAFIQSRQAIDISGCSDDRLEEELNLLADAYLLLEEEESSAWER